MIKKRWANPTFTMNINRGYTRQSLALLLMVVLLVGSVSGQKQGGGGKNKNPTEEESFGSSDSDNSTSTGPTLTGIPQIDYIHDPNLPIELAGYDLSDYPFYKRVPKEGHNFTCDGRHDGFYASIRHKCQVYYNCLFSQRYDFLCANYTVFDQVNFICHYASEVDCKNSERYYDRNEELYVTTTTTTQAPIIIYRDRPQPARPRRPARPLLRRPKPPLRRNNRPGKEPTTTTPASTNDKEYHDYYDQDYYNDYYDYYQDDTTTTTTTTTSQPKIRRRRPGGGGRRPGGGRPGGPGRRRQGGGGGRRRFRTTTTTTQSPVYEDDYYYYDDDYYQDDIKSSNSTSNTITKEEKKAEPEVVAPAQPTRRQRPGQSRRPNFRRSQSNPESPTKTESVSADQPTNEVELVDEPAEGNVLAAEPGLRPLRRLVSKPINSRGVAEEPSEDSLVKEPIAPPSESTRRRSGQRLPAPRNEPGEAGDDIPADERPRRRPSISGFGGRRT